MENGTLRTIMFDTAKMHPFTKGIPYEIVLDGQKNLALWVDLRLAGEFGLRVVDASLAERYPLSDEDLGKSLVTALLSALGKGAAVFGQPEDFLMEGHIFKEEMKEKTSFLEKSGLSLELVRIREAEPLPDSQVKLEMMQKQLERMRMMEDITSGKVDPLKAFYGPGVMTNDISLKADAGSSGAKQFPGEASGNVRPGMPGGSTVSAASSLSAPVKITGPWLCGCGTRNESKFCTNCGSPRQWTCTCGQENLGNYCTSCGKKRS